MGLQDEMQKVANDILKYGRVEGDKLIIDDGVLSQVIGTIRDKEPTMDELRIKLGTAYENIIEALKKYTDLKPDVYNIIALWIIGARFHDEFPTYPYLFLNAMRGSGKTRLLKLISFLCDGEILNSPTEAVLFRTKGMLAIDEFEGVMRKGNENVRELLNSAYKKGTKVRRMRKQKLPDGETQVPEEFDVYRPVCLANIWGMEEVLADRCISIIIEKSNKEGIVKLMELFESDKTLILTKNLLSSHNQCSLCSVVTPNIMYELWNEYIYTKYINYNNNNNYTNYTEDNNKKIDKKYLDMFIKIDESGIDGRHLELTLPLLFIANNINEDVFNETLVTIKNIVEEKRSDDMSESRDVSFIDFISQESEEDYFIPIKNLTEKFKEFLQDRDEWINEKWVGRALKRLSLAIEKKRGSRGMEVRLNVIHAQEKLRQFKR